MQPPKKSVCITFRIDSNTFKNLQALPAKSPHRAAREIVERFFIDAGALPLLPPERHVPECSVPRGKSSNLLSRRGGER